MKYTNITGKATIFPISLLFIRIVQILQQGTKRRMRFLWPADFSRLGVAKIDKISYVQRIVEKKLKK